VDPHWVPASRGRRRGSGCGSGGRASGSGGAPGCGCRWGSGACDCMVATVAEQYLGAATGHHTPLLPADARLLCADTCVQSSCLIQLFCHDVTAPSPHLMGVRDLARDAAGSTQTSHDQRHAACCRWRKARRGGGSSTMVTSPLQPPGDLQHRLDQCPWRCLGARTVVPSPHCADRCAEWCRWAVFEQECGESGSSSSSKAGSGASADMAVTVPAAGKVAAAPTAAGAASPVAAQATAAAAAVGSCTAKVRPRGACLGFREGAPAEGCASGQKEGRAAAHASGCGTWAWRSGRAPGSGS
jgi:hypothetical protein